MSKIDITKPPHPAVIKPASGAASDDGAAKPATDEAAAAATASVADEAPVDDVAAALVGGEAEPEPAVTRGADESDDGAADVGNVSLADMLDEAVEAIMAPAAQRERKAEPRVPERPAAQPAAPEQQPEPAAPAVPVAHGDDALTEDERRQYGASEPFVAKVARREARGIMADMQRKLDEMQRRLDEALGNVSSVAERTTNVARSQFEAALSARVPDLQSLVVDTKFKAFLRRRVPGAGVTWGQALADATRAMSVQRVVEVIDAARAAMGAKAPQGAMAPGGRVPPTAAPASKGAALTPDVFGRIDAAISEALRSSPAGVIDADALNLARDRIYAKMQEGITVKEALESVRAVRGGQEVINRLRR